MTTLHAAILGTIQGLTEFLPVSSSGHLVFFQHLLGYEEPLIAFDLLVHLGTLFAIVIYFWQDLWQMFRSGFLLCFRFYKIKEWDRYFFQDTHALIFCYAIVTTFVTFLIAFSFKEAFEIFFGSVYVVGGAWIVMGILLLGTRKIESECRDFYQMNHRDCFFIGLAQGLALIPGISRSGATIIAGMRSGLDPKVAAKFSFLIGFIAILGAGILGAKDGVEFFQENTGALVAGFLSSAIVGYFAIVLVMKLVEKGKFFVFGLYCLTMGILTLVLCLLGKI